MTLSSSSESATNQAQVQACPQMSLVFTTPSGGLSRGPAAGNAAVPKLVAWIPCDLDGAGAPIPEGGHRFESGLLQRRVIERTAAARCSSSIPAVEVIRTFGTRCGPVKDCAKVRDWINRLVRT